MVSGLRRTIIKNSNHPAAGGIPSLLTPHSYLKERKCVMRAIVTVTGKDNVGIIGGVCTKLSHYNVNILDISQTVLQGFFTMTMVVDVSEANEEFGALIQQMADYGAQRKLAIRVQREDIFDAMHKI